MKQTPSEELFLEALAARIRLGENIWTFNSRHIKTAKSLEEQGIIGWKHGIVENSILAWFTERGEAECLSYHYLPPIAEDSKKATARAEKIWLDAEKLQAKFEKEDAKVDE